LAFAATVAGGRSGRGPCHLLTGCMSARANQARLPDQGPDTSRPGRLRARSQDAEVRRRARRGAGGNAQHTLTSNVPERLSYGDVCAVYRSALSFRARRSVRSRYLPRVSHVLLDSSRHGADSPGFRTSPLINSLLGPQRPQSASPFGIAEALLNTPMETWQIETLSENPDPMSASNKSSINQIANLKGHRILLTWASLFELTSGPFAGRRFRRLGRGALSGPKLTQLGCLAALAVAASVAASGTAAASCIDEVHALAERDQLTPLSGPTASRVRGLPVPGGARLRCRSAAGPAPARPGTPSRPASARPA